MLGAYAYPCGQSARAVGGAQHSTSQLFWAPPPQGQEPAIPAPKFSEDQRLAPLRSLLTSRLASDAAAPQLPEAELLSLSATQLRDRLLALAPLDASWVKRVNTAEAEYWRRW